MKYPTFTGTDKISFRRFGNEKYPTIFNHYVAIKYPDGATDEFYVVVRFKKPLEEKFPIEEQEVYDYNIGKWKSLFINFTTASRLSTVELDSGETLLYSNGGNDGDYSYMQPLLLKIKFFPKPLRSVWSSNRNIFIFPKSMMPTQLDESGLFDHLEEIENMDKRYEALLEIIGEH